MAESGVAYITSKDGIIRAIIIVFACITFALVAAFGYGGPIAWVLAAFIIAFCISLLIYFFTVVDLISKMNCGVPFEAVDFVISVILFFICLSASIVLSIYNCSVCDEWIAANIFGFFTTILYFVEIYLHQDKAPEPMKYLTKTNGLVKLAVVIFGCTTFALLVAGRYDSRFSDCDSGRTFSLAAYIIGWCGSLIFLLLYVTGLGEKIGDKFPTADFIWSVFCFVFYLTASIVLAVYTSCDYKSNRRIAAVVFGFITTILYLVEAILLKATAKIDAITE